MGTASRDKDKESFWRRIIREQPRSGFSIRAWCGRHRVRESSFYWWRRELERRDAQAPQFAPVRVASDVAGAERGRFVGDFVDLATLNGPRSHIEIVLPNEHCVRVVGAVDRQMLTDVLAVLRDEGAVEVKDKAVRPRRSSLGSDGRANDRRCVTARKGRPC